MVENDRFLVTNIRQYLNSDNPKLGEDKLVQELSGFSCQKNWDIENYLKKNAIEFTKKNQSVTYLVFSLKSMALVGYFTIALKPLTVRGEKVSNTIKKKIIITSTAMIWFFFLLFNSHNNIKPENSLATNNEQQSTEMSQGNSLEELDNNNINETATNYLETETQQTETQQEDITDKNEENPSEETESHISVTKSANISTYVLNTSTKKFHKKSCSAVKRMKKSNYSEYSGTYDDVISMGYSACKTCKPR